jgi:4-amino-4-deoxy-L-arabinose transferase-like glycosyltransferase
MSTAGLDEPSSNSPVASVGPQTLGDSLSWIWSRVLFAGQAEKGVAAGPLPFLFLLLLSSVLLYPSLAFPLFEPDETRYAEIPREMLARGDWIVPYLQGQPYLDKPPLLYWLVMVSDGLLGVDILSARLVTALAVQLTFLLVYFLARRSIGRRAAFWGTLLLVLAPGFTGMGRFLILDGLLTLWIVLSQLAVFEAVRMGRFRWSWWLVGATACALGILTKGPVALVLLAPPIWLYRRLSANRVPLGWRRLLAFTGIVFVLVIPWYVAVCLRMPAFARHFLWEHNLVRFLSPFDHLQPIWYYGPVVLFGLLPGTLLLVPFLRFMLTSDKTAAARRSPELGFMLLAGGWSVFFFTLSGCKLPTYVVPAFPPLCLSLGVFVAATKWHKLPWFRGVLAGSFALLCLGQHLAVPWYATFRSPVSQPEEIARLCGNPDTPVVCYPRECNAVAFLLKRADLRSFRSKEVDALRLELLSNPRTIILCTHRHSLQGIKQFLPPNLCITEERRLDLVAPGFVPAWLAHKLNSLAGETALGLADVAVVEHKPAEVQRVLIAELPGESESD